MKNKLFSLSFVTMALFCTAVFGQIKSVDISGHMFLNYEAGKSKGENVNQFDVTRGYLNFKADLGNGFSARMTPDITLDTEGSDAGSVEMKLKYLYLKYKFEDFGIFTSPYFEAGIIHRTSLDYEQKINHYRVQGKMFIERHKILGSADYGVAFFSLLGGKVDKKYQDEVSKDYPGKYGSFAVGVYNGGGYQAFENNKNKTLETRLSLRPLALVLPNLQVTYFGTFGKGNTAEMPDYTAHNLMMSFEHQAFTFAAQYYAGEGNAAGNATLEKTLNGQTKLVSYDQKGYSIFAEAKLIRKKLSIFGRYDSFTREKTTDEDNDVIIFGAAYTLHKGIRLVADYDASRKNDLEYGDNSMFKLSLDVKF